MELELEKIKLIEKRKRDGIKFIEKFLKSTDY